MHIYVRMLPVTSFHITSQIAVNFSCLPLYFLNSPSLPSQLDPSPPSHNYLFYFSFLIRSILPPLASSPSLYT